MKQCGAKTKQDTFCQGNVLKNGRCRLHGGLSTGAKTEAGIQRQRIAHLKHGYYTNDAIAQRKQLRQLLKASNQLLAEIQLMK